MQRALRPYITTGIAILGAGIIAMPAAVPPMPDGQVRAVRLVNGEDVAFIIGGSGNPIPDDNYVNINNTLFVQPNFLGYSPQALFTPEGNYALYTGVKSLTLDQSEAQGAQILDKAINQQVDAENHVAVFGDSQSSTISSIVMPELATQPHPVPSSYLGFVLTGDPNLPDGGLFARADGLTLPSLGITFNGATPDDLYPTTIYTQAYDGFADVPRYPIDFLSDLNSVLGIQYVHPTYQGLTSGQIGEADIIHPAGSMTTYYMIPLSAETVPYLPLLQPLLAIPVVGKPLADMLQPVLTPLVNLGYGDPDFAFSQGPPNVPTEFGLFPSFDMVLKAFQETVAGIPTGVQAAIHDIESPGAAGLSLPDLSSMLTSDPLAGLSAADTTSATGPLTELTNIVDALTNAFSTGYAALLPTADVITALTITLPTYDANLFAQGLEAGNLLEAIGQPIASDTYLLTLAAGFETFALLSTVEMIAGDLSGLIPS